MVLEKPASAGFFMSGEKSCVQMVKSLHAATNMSSVQVPATGLI